MLAFKLQFVWISFRKLLKILRHYCRVQESILLRSGEKTRSVDGKIDEGDEKEEKEAEEAVRMLF